MKLYTDKGNPNLLRIFAAKNLSGVRLDVLYLNQEDQPGFKFSGSTSKLPALEVEDGNYLFSPNAICRYVFKSSQTQAAAQDVEKQAAVDQWIEWESLYLQPAVESQILSIAHKSATSSDQKQSLPELLKKIDESLKKQKNLSGETIGLADVVVWGSLFPLTSQQPELIGSEFESLRKWHSNIISQEAFKNGAQEAMGERGPAAFKDYYLAQTSKESKEKASKNEPTEENGGITIAKIQASADEINNAFDAWTQSDSKMPKARKLSNPVLPIEGEKNYLITSALPYVNNVPHLGNIIGCVLSADVFARYCRLRGYNTLYICGTDEYGTATETKALEEGITPQEICDKYFKIHSDVYSWFNIDFDFFGRTCTEQQTKISQDIFWRLHERGNIVEDSIKQLQCLDCKRFLADRFVEGTCPFCNYPDARGDQCDSCGKLINAIELKNPKCKVCGGKPEANSSKHLFLDLAELEPTLKAWVEKSSNEGCWSSNARQITRSWIQEGLKPRCITRDLKWGTPVPLEGYTDKVFYVWFDAPIGYLSITANYTEQWEKWWKNPQHVASYQFMAKDNVPFHTVVFPCTLLGADDNYTLLDSINATEYLNYEDDKFSKSRGVGVFGDDAEDSGIPADIWRFYLLYIRPEGQDSAFSWSDFVLKNNSELLNNLGNFINRALMFLNNNFNGVVPEMTLNDEDKNFVALINRELKTYVENMEKIRLREGLKVLLNISKYGNQYVQGNKPWVLIKGSEAERHRAGTVIGVATNLSFLLSVLVHPYMPVTSQEIRSQLKVDDDTNALTEQFVPVLKPGHKIGTPKPLFQKIESSLAEELRKKYAGQTKVTAEEPSPAPAAAAEQKDASGK
ncbi:methionine--tRNA ligase, cytoplasmic-like isoform X2 [Actinia tenebrosa]|uniref:Methionine--tRNA ligase, cytoplasmic n=1 Tax=Actinia tenebrosa TaxID=6105 RepID=A0A6P8JBA4_ACTTE|nr:methionine--tRNA ligase, cytoplasmic-like isoform X2 [Actinia tenebrosa]